MSLYPGEENVTHKQVKHEKVWLDNPITKQNMKNQNDVEETGE